MFLHSILTNLFKLNFFFKPGNEGRPLFVHWNILYFCDRKLCLQCKRTQRYIIERNKHWLGDDRVKCLDFSENRLWERLMPLHRNNLSIFSLQIFLKNLSSKNEHVDQEHSILFFRDLSLTNKWKIKQV